jgi:two-component system, OmpR family, phosphate regulon sensor histidine kinase PhoR
MKEKTFRYFIIFAIVVVIGIFAVQSVLLKNSFDLSEKQFNESTLIALKEVAWQILEYNRNNYGHSADFNNLEPVEKAANDYYIVNVNDVIDGEVLKFYLTEEFKKQSINADFEFAVYDCDNDKMEYGAYISALSDTSKQFKSFNLPKSDKFTYYFVVHFPNRSQYFNSSMKGSFVFTILLVIVVLFFGYTLFVIIRQRQLSEIQKNFINNLTHELKTPISSIGLAAKVLNDTSIIRTPDRLFEYTRIIQEQNQRLSKNVERVLDLASIEKNKIKLEPVSVDLNDFIEKIITQFRESASGNYASIEFEKDADNPIVLADKFHLTQVALNILENSSKYCTKTPEIKVKLDKTKRRIHVIFSDNGIGIPRNARKKIFQKFYRVPTGDVHNVKGFGLGLDYVKKIVNTHKWKIKVDGNPKGGSIFTIFIPRNKHGKHHL